MAETTNENFDAGMLQDNPGMLPERLTVPALPLSGTLVFPYALTPLVIESPDSIEQVTKAAAGDRLLALFPEMPEEDGHLEQNGLEINVKTLSFEGRKLSAVGVLGRIVKLLKFPDNTVRVLIRGLSRIRELSLNRENKQTIVKRISDSADSNKIEVVAMIKNAIKQFQEIVSYSPNFPEELKIAVLNLNDNTRITDLIADTVNISYAEKLAILVMDSLEERLQLLTILLNREVEVQKLGTEIQSQVHNALGKSQREFFLREQLRTIKEELGEETRNPDLVAFHAKLEKFDAPENVVETVKKELERLELIQQSSAEYTVSYNYIDWLFSVPWHVYTEDRLDIKEAAKILDRDHFGLKDVKERILEFLSVLQLKKDRKSPILCFAGPPGVGKTSLGQSIANAMGRKFIRMSLGGIKDEAEIRGHRRTYIGALPGRIIQGLKKAGTANPVFMLDEIDKIGTDFRGDPASALLEVLDPQQNNAFNDHYLEVDCDLSGVLFIATANMLDTIPAPLLDRMDIITLPGYTPDEKRSIAEKYLIPRQLSENGLDGRNIDFQLSAVDEIINSYTREAGVRSLERTIGSVLRKVARKVVDESFNPKKDSSIDAKSVNRCLGAKKFLMDELPEHPEVGTAIGMAWTSVGGTILQIEATSMPGKGDLKLTGSLGDVMKESALAAFSYIKSHAGEFHLLPEDFSKKDYHIHVPDGATPKDGPSAGTALATALISILTGRKIQNHTSMTGEITLHGKVTAVGGIKEKVIGAMRAGVTSVIMPKENEKDLENLPEEVRRKVKFHFVSGIAEVWKLVLMPPERKKKISKKDAPVK